MLAQLNPFAKSKAPEEVQSTKQTAVTQAPVAPDPNPAIPTPKAPIPNTVQGSPVPNTMQGIPSPNATPAAVDNRQAGVNLAANTAANGNIIDYSNIAAELKAINSFEELEQAKFHGIEDKNKTSINSAKTILKSIGFGKKTDNTKQKIAPYVSQAPAEPAQISVVLDSKSFADNFLNTSISQKLFGWIGRLFGKPNKALAAKWLKANSGINFFDPELKHSHMLNPKKLKQALENGRYFISVIYKADEKTGKFSKEPEAIMLMDRLHKVIKQAERAAENKNMPEELKKMVQEQTTKMHNQGLDSYALLDTAILNPSVKDRYNKKDPESLVAREKLIASTIEGLNPDVNLVIPHSVFNSENSRTNRHLYETLHNMKFLYTDENDNGHVGMYDNISGTLVRNINNRNPIPAEELSGLINTAMITEHTSDVTKLKAETLKNLDGFLKQATAANTAAFSGVNQRLGLIAPTTK